MLSNYELLLDLGTINPVCLAFSSLGSKLAAITSDGFINIWTLSTGKRHYPMPRRTSVEESCICWLDDSVFVCGFNDGSLLTGHVNPDGLEELDLQQVKVSQSAILTIAFNATSSLLAIANQDRAVTLWKRGEQYLIHSFVNVMMSKN